MTGPQYPGQPYPGQPNPGQPNQGQPNPYQPPQQPQPVPPTQAAPSDQFAPIPPQAGQAPPQGQFPGQQQFAQPGQPQYPGPQNLGQQYPGQQFGGQPYGGQPAYQGQAPAPKSNSNKIVLAVLGVLVVIGAVVGILFATGVFGGGGIGGNSDEKQIRALYSDFSSDLEKGDLKTAFARMCSMPDLDDLGLSDLGIDMGDVTDMLDQMGIDMQSEMAKEMPQNITINSIEITGDSATVGLSATINGSQDTDTSTAKKVNGEWCIAS